MYGVISDIRRGVATAFTDVRWLTMLLFLTVADQLTKLLVVAEFDLHDSVAIIPGLFNLVYVRNFGAAFGIFAGLDSPLREILLFSSTTVAIGVVFAFLGGMGRENRVGRLALALVFGGAVGNLIDRLRLGYVIDFLDFHIGEHHWPAFNLADSFICIGVVLLVFLPREEESAAQHPQGKL
jgi:signal peptidase II